MARLSKQDWLEEGFKLLSEFAQDKLRILYLCERLQVTRGSFYHHFTGIDHYVAALLEEWERQNTLELIRRADQGDAPEVQMEILAQQVKEKNQAVEAAIRSWSFYHPTVRKHLQKVDEIRLGYLENIFSNLGAPPKTARIRAQLDYATLIGIQQLLPNASPDEMNQLWAVQRQIGMAGLDP